MFIHILPLIQIGILSYCILFFDSSFLCNLSLYLTISLFPTVRENVMKHTTPLTKSYFFKNENAADRVTLLGIYMYIHTLFSPYIIFTI